MRGRASTRCVLPLFPLAASSCGRRPPPALCPCGWLLSAESAACCMLLMLLLLGIPSRVRIVYRAFLASSLLCFCVCVSRVAHAGRAAKECRGVALSSRCSSQRACGVGPVPRFCASFDGRRQQEQSNQSPSTQTPSLKFVSRTLLACSSPRHRTPRRSTTCFAYLRTTPCTCARS